MKKFRRCEKSANFAVAKCQSGCSTVGSAPRSGRGGRKFESSHPDLQTTSNNSYVKGSLLFLSSIKSAPTGERPILIDTQLLPFAFSRSNGYSGNDSLDGSKFCRCQKAIYFCNKFLASVF